MWLKWLPWKYLISKAALKNNFLDPTVIWSHLQNFAQPSEVAGPIELIRASTVFHARGLINSRAIPQNSDWVWPYWVNRQFNPFDTAFIPKAFSLTYINLTERNWTAIGLPGLAELPIIDRAGLVTPFWDGWSLDFWLVEEDGQVFTAARSEGKTRQRLFYDNNLTVVTRNMYNSGSLCSAAWVDDDNGNPACNIKIRFKGSVNSKLAVSLRPYNPEGISFINSIKFDKDRNAWVINEKDIVYFDHPIDSYHLSKYNDGDVANHLAQSEYQEKVDCNVGMASAAALFCPKNKNTFEVKLSIPLHDDRKSAWRNITNVKSIKLPPKRWSECMEGYCKIDIPDKRIQLIYERALRAIVLHTNDRDVYPGPFTYKRFWFRDASFILNALITANLGFLAKSVLDSYPGRQKSNGYFESQYGEWDSNGQAIWILHKYWKTMESSELDNEWLQAIEKASDWICKRCHSTKIDKMHAGLLPAGFSAEHFGPNDHYYWDNFWAIAGLECAAEIYNSFNKEEKSSKYKAKANELRNSIETSLVKVANKIHTNAIPVSPYRRMDSGAVGSLVCGYPLQLYGHNDPRLLATAKYLVENCLYEGGFFLDISHSGVNPYLTLHVAQVLLRAGDSGHIDLANAICKLTSSTDQWPEAVHPRTSGGCMGDGQHIWAAAEWVVYLRNCLIYEEETRNQVILGAGIRPSWLQFGKTIKIGPAPTLWGPISVAFYCKKEGINIRLITNWTSDMPEVIIKIPGYHQMIYPANTNEILVRRKQ